MRALGFFSGLCYCLLRSKYVFLSFDSAIFVNFAVVNINIARSLANVAFKISVYISMSNS